VPAVNFDFLDRRSAERFAELLDDSGGRRHHAARRPINGGPGDEQLAELVSVGKGLSAARPGVSVDPEFRVGLRAMLVATAERDGIGRTAMADDHEATTASETTAASKSGSRFAVFGLGGRRIRARGAIVIGVAAGAMAVSGISAASENAAPGDALYGVKRSAERAQLAMAGSDVTRGQLSLDFARTRLAEATALPGDDKEFGSVLNDMDNSTRKGVSLLTTSAVARKDTKPLTTVDNFAAGQQRTLEPVLSRLSDTNRTRALASISLLDSVQQRVDDLRGGLNCSSVSPIGTDMLGPKLHACSTQPNNDSTLNRPNGHSGKLSGRSPVEDAPAHPKRTASPAASNSNGPDAVEPTAATNADTSNSGTSGGIAPNVLAPGIAPNGLVPSDNSVPVPTSTVDKGKGALGGLLGGILGGS
jgi:uncharacterized protein DUF5667